MKEFLMVNFPVDLGNRTIESNLRDIFHSDMDFLSFAEEHKEQSGSVKIGKWRSYYFRAKSAVNLRRKVASYQRAGKQVLFNSISPALFSYGKWNNSNSALILDWTRTLYPYVRKEKIKRDMAFSMHKNILNSSNRILCWSDALIENLQEIYGVKSSSLIKAPAPFLFEKMDNPPRLTPEKPRVLFVGGDFYRKGGDIILDAVKKGLTDNCTLSLMTNDQQANISGVNFLPGIKYGSADHKRIFNDHDILLLPTRMDSLPQVIGEAASAGLAVITTQFALASKDVIDHGESGFIAKSPEDCIMYLYELLNKPTLIDSFKQKGYDLMKSRYSAKTLRPYYLNLLS
ncbi:MAG: glycosyltransferase family 4 protein [Flavitalea sp.]